MLKKMLSLIIALVLALGIFSFTVSAAGITATPTASTVLVNGKSVAFDAYQIAGNNYFKLRDLAYTLSGSAKQFDVVWDGTRNAISLTSSKAYTVEGGEMAGKGSGNKAADPTTSKIYIDGKEVQFTAYHISGNNYFKLRDIGQAFNFGIDWDGAKNTIVIDTNKGYTPDGYPVLAPLVSWATPVPDAKLLENYKLNVIERRLYHQLVMGIANFDLAIQVDMTPRNEAELDTLRKVRSLVYYTHPEFFWWNNHLYYTTDGRPSNDGKYYLRPVYIINEKELRASVSGANNTIVYPAAADIAAAKNWVESGKAAIRKKLNELPLRAGMTAFEMELAVYDWQCDNLTYDGSDFAKHEFNTIHGALVEGRVDCSGYSRTFQYIMNLVGVENVIIKGLSPNGDNHAWNAVRLDGEWYRADVTFDGSLRNRENLPSHFHLNRTDSFMAGRGYTIGVGESFYENPNITCTATKHNYYIMTGSHIASDADFISKVPAYISRARANGERYFDMEFAESYAQSSEIYNKLKLIDSNLWAGIEFKYHKTRGQVFGIFK